MTRDELAALLNGREYRSEITDSEEALAKQHNLLVVFGYSDDNVEFRGLFDDEIGAFNGRKLLIDKSGVIPTWDTACEDEGSAKSYFARKKRGHKVEAVWHDQDGPCWTFETAIPHAMFLIMEDGEPFCLGIVIDGKDLE